MQAKLARMRAELADLTSSVEELSHEQVELHGDLGHARLCIDNAQQEVGQAQRHKEIVHEEVLQCNARLADAADGVQQSLRRPEFLHTGVSSAEASCCIVSTLKGVCPEELTTWLSHHLDHCKFCRAYLFFDNPSEFVCNAGFLARWADRVIATSVGSLPQQQYVSCQRYEALRSRLEEDWLARQELHVEIAMRWARDIGIHWLLHIDLDELFLLGQGTAPQHFGSISDSIDTICYLNHEGVPELGESNVEDKLHHNRFAGVQLFRKNPQCFGEGSHLRDLLPRISGCRDWDDGAWERKLDNFVAESISMEGSDAQARQSFAFWLKRTKQCLGRAQYFLAYANGKGAVRLRSGLLPCGVHGFGSQQHLELFWTPREAAVLHYAHGSFQAFVEKMRRLRVSRGTWWKRFALYSQGRENDVDALDYIYRRAIALDADDAQEARRQVEIGICFRYVAKMPDSCGAEGGGASFLAELD